MNRSGLLLAVGSVLAGTAVLFAVLGVVYSPLLALVAAPFAAAAYFLWSDATGRLQARMRERATVGSAGGDAGRGARRARSRYARAARARATASPDGDRRRERPVDSTPEIGRSEARDVLGIDADADEEAIERAYRERVKEVHPDREGGDEEAFKRVIDAYDRLSD